MPDFSNGRLKVQVTLNNPATVPAKDVMAHVRVLSAEGNELFAQDVYFGTLAPKQSMDKAFDEAHPDGTSMPHGGYQADVTVTFNR